MNIPNLLQQHDKAKEILQEIQYKEKAKQTVQDSIDGFGGQNFPEQKKEWQRTVERLQEQIAEMKVDYKMFLNSIR